MRRRDRAVLAVLAVVATAVVTCALFVCKELPQVEEALDEARPDFAPPRPETVTIEDADAVPATRAERVSRKLSVGRSYRRRGLAPRWTMRPPERVRPPAAKRLEPSPTPRRPWAPGPEELPE